MFTGTRHLFNKGIIPDGRGKGREKLESVFFRLTPLFPVVGFHLETGELDFSVTHVIRVRKVRTTRESGIGATNFCSVYMLAVVRRE
jgi:hypothetical protein